MNTPYVKISTIRKFDQWDTILGYRPSLVLENSIGNKQSIWMTHELYSSSEEAQIAYDNGTVTPYMMKCQCATCYTEQVDEINDKELWRQLQ